MENIRQVRERHKREIQQLQQSCKHENSKRMAYMWAIGHSGNDVEVCSWCGKIIKHYTDRQPIKSQEDKQC